MATHLLQAGYEMRVFSRTRAKAEKLLEMGAQWADSPAEAAEASQVVLSMLGYPEEVEEVLLGENGVRDALREGGIVVDMTTSSPDLALRIAREMERKKCFALDAPVSGGDVGANNASLAIMCGGQRVRFLSKPCPFWKCWASGFAGLEKRDLVRGLRWPIKSSLPRP